MRLLLFLILIINPLYALDINQSVKSTIENNPKVKIAQEKLNESKELIEMLMVKNYLLSQVRYLELTLILTLNQQQIQQHLKLLPININ